MDTAQWSQGIEMLSTTTNTTTTITNNNNNNNNMMMMMNNNTGTSTRPAASASASHLVERRARPAKEHALNCPRCNSTNTKFCYYNNYSLTQPRYFCKACRRYWTEGGSLRNVPVGGGSRKNKKHSSSSSTSSKIININNNNNNNINNPPPIISSSSSSLTLPAAKSYHGHDLNLGFPELIGGYNSNNSNSIGAMELLRSTGISPLVHMSMAPETGGAMYSAAGLGLHDFGHGIKFSLDGNGDSAGNMQDGVSAGRLLFPFGDHLKVKTGNIESASDHDQHQIKAQGGDPSAMYWGGGSW